MGRGNVSVSGKYEGLFYIDNDDYTIYRMSDDYSDYPELMLARDLGYDEIAGGDFIYDEEGTMCELDFILDSFCEDFMSRYPSFTKPMENKSIRSGLYGYMSRQVILESGLFYIAIEDNEWSTAIELLQKEDPYDNHLAGLQGRHFKAYFAAMADCLLDLLPGIGTYAGPWTHGRIKRGELLT